MDSFTAIVVGLGAMGSATLYQLAKRGIKALGIDHLSPPHTLGSTHGDTRITRQAIGEGTYYTPLSLRSYEIFREVQAATNSRLLETPGALIIASQSERTSSAKFFQNTIDAAKQYDIPHEILSAKEIRSRFPAFNVDDDELGYHEFEGGFLRPEECVAKQLRLAKELGATIHTQESFKNFEETGDGVTVHTDKGTYKCEKLVLSVGPWLPQVVSELSNVFKVYRQVLYWFDVERSFNEFVPENFPVFIWELKGHENGIYGFPAVDGTSGGFKIASERLLDNVTPESVDRSVSEADTMMMFENKVHPFFPKASSKCVKSVVCLYTSTQDTNFVIDWLPNSQNIIVCSPCSGHGFKHSAAIGECVAQLVTAGETSIDLSEFNLARLL